MWNVHLLIASIIYHLFKKLDANTGWLENDRNWAVSYEFWLFQLLAKKWLWKWTTSFKMLVCNKLKEYISYGIVNGSLLGFPVLQISSYLGYLLMMPMISMVLVLFILWWVASHNLHSLWVWCFYNASKNRKKVIFRYLLIL